MAKQDVVDRRATAHKVGERFLVDHAALFLQKDSRISNFKIEVRNEERIHTLNSIALTPLTHQQSASIMHMSTKPSPTHLHDHFQLHQRP